MTIAVDLGRKATKQANTFIWGPVVDTPSTIRFVLCFQKSKRSQRNLKGNSGVGEKLANSDMECGEMMMSIHPNKGIKLGPLHPFTNTLRFSSLHAGNF